MDGSSIYDNFSQYFKFAFGAFCFAISLALFLPFGFYSGLSFEIENKSGTAIGPVQLVFFSDQTRLQTESRIVEVDLIPAFGRRSVKIPFSNSRIVDVHWQDQILRDVVFLDTHDRSGCVRVSFNGSHLEQPNYYSRSTCGPSRFWQDVLQWMSAAPRTYEDLY